MTTNKFWIDLSLPRQDEDEPWELLHENSKTSRFEAFPDEAMIVERMLEFYESLPYAGYSEIQLPEERIEFDESISEVMSRRVTCRNMKPGKLSIQQLATLLFNTYGITRDNADNEFPRPFRIAPSGGGLYPLEVFFHTSQVDGLEPGLYHYHPDNNSVRQLRDRDESLDIAQFLVQDYLALGSSIVFFFTAVFERSTFKYNDRGYRFILIEAGHVAQNLILTATAMGLGTTPIGGYFDREADEYLGIDGLRHSTIYMVAIGQSQDTT